MKLAIQLLCACLGFTLYPAFADGTTTVVTFTNHYPQDYVVTIANQQCIKASGFDFGKTIPANSGTAQITLTSDSNCANTPSINLRFCSPATSCAETDTFILGFNLTVTLSQGSQTSRVEAWGTEGVSAPVLSTKNIGNVDASKGPTITATPDLT